MVQPLFWVMPCSTKYTASIMCEICQFCQFSKILGGDVCGWRILKSRDSKSIRVWDLSSVVNFQGDKTLPLSLWRIRISGRFQDFLKFLLHCTLHSALFCTRPKKRNSEWDNLRSRLIAQIWHFLSTINILSTLMSNMPFSFNNYRHKTWSILILYEIYNHLW